MLLRQIQPTTKFNSELNHPSELISEIAAKDVGVVVEVMEFVDGAVGLDGEVVSIGLELKVDDK